MGARKRRRKFTAKALLGQLTTEARSLQSVAIQMELLTSHRVSLIANLLSDLSSECRRGIETMQAARKATTIEEARQVLNDYLTLFDK